MNRSLRVPLALLAGYIVSLLVALFAARGWLEKNAIFALAAFGLVLWRFVQALAFERIAEPDLRALTSWLFDRPGETRVAQIALVGRQGCTRAECSALRKELSAARQVLEDAGIPRSRLGWEGLSDELARGAPKLESDDDMLRLAVLGGLPRAQDRLAARAAELRGEPLGVVYEWLRTGRVDEAELTRIAASLDPEHDGMQDFDTPEPWLLFATPNPRARTLLKLTRKELKRDRRRLESDGDGDFAEQVHRTTAAVQLLSAVEASWDSGSRAGLPAAFREYARTTLDFYFLESLVCAAWLDARLSEPPLPPAEALGRLRALLPAMSPPVDPRAEAAPALRALDAVAAKLWIGLGLTLRSANGEVVLVALPQTVERDFI